MQTLIIEVRDGLVQEVYSDAKDLRIVLVDWDAGESPGDSCAGGDFATQPIGNLPEETMRAVLSLTA
jgi:hypothetical protein